MRSAHAADPPGDAGALRQGKRIGKSRGQLENEKQAYEFADSDTFVSVQAVAATRSNPFN
eukprot:9474000-Pyramimonas_sp.AAC.1